MELEERQKLATIIEKITNPKEDIEHLNKVHLQVYT
jgi:hypothetical protein